MCAKHRAGVPHVCTILHYILYKTGDGYQVIRPCKSYAKENRLYNLDTAGTWEPICEKHICIETSTGHMALGVHDV